MAQTIKIKNSGTSGNTPSSLVHGELAINYADGKIFYKNSGNSIVEFSTSGSFLPLSGGTLTGNLSIANGSVGSPAIRFASDTDTGIFRGGADNLIIATGGASRLTVTSAGIFSSANVYSGTTGSYRNFGGTWAGTTGTANNGFYFLNTANSNTTKAMDLSHDGNVVFAGEIEGASLDINGNADISGTLTVSTAGSSIKSPLYMGVQNSTGEGGEIVLSGSNSNTGHTLDTVNGSFRIFDNNGTLLSGNSGYGLSVVNGYRVNGTQVITSGRAAQNITSLSVDNITIDGTEIDCNTSLFLDVGGNLTIDVDGTTITLADGGSNWGQFFNSSQNFYIKNPIANKDIIFQGIDGSTTITALSLDMSAAGNAVFNGSITADTGVIVDQSTFQGNAITTSTASSHSGDFTIDAAGDITLDADGGDLIFADNGTTIIGLHNDSGNGIIKVNPNNGDLKLKGTGNSSEITAATFDMSNDGFLTLNDGISINASSFMASGTLMFNGGNAAFVDDKQCFFGSSLDMTIKHNSSTGNNEILTNSDLLLDSATNIILDADGGTIDLMDGGTRFGRLQQMIGGLGISAGSTPTFMQLLSSTKTLFFGHIELGDSKHIQFGNSGGDLQIYHDGSNSYIKEYGTGNLYITSDNGNINLQTNGSENAVKCIQNGAVEVYYDGNKKLETKSDGVDITGELQSDSLDVDGVADISGNTTITGNSSSGNALLVNRGDGGGQGIRIHNTGEVVASTNYIYAAYTGGASFYSQKEAVFRNGILNDGGDLEVKDNLDITTSGGFKMGGTTVLNSARVLQNVSGNISMFTNDAGYITGGNFVATNADSTVATNKKIQFRDANNFINSHAGSELGVNAEESLHLNAASEVLVGGTSGTAQIQLKSEDIQLKDFTLSGSTVPYADVTQNVTNTASGLQDQNLSGSGSGASNLGSLGIDQGGRIVRHEQEQTFRFSRAQMLASFGGNGITLIPAVGNDKAMIITEMVTMIEFTSAITGGAGTSNPLVVTGGGSSSTMFELRSVPGSFATGVIGAIPRTAFAQATQTTTSGSAPHYGFIYRDLPSGTSSAQKIMCSNNDLKIHKIGTISQMGTGVTAMYIKIRYKIFNGSTF